MKKSPGLLALAPLLAGTRLLLEAIVIGLAGLLLILASGPILATLRRSLQGPALCVAALLVGALLVGTLELLLRLGSPELANAVAPYLPLLLLPWPTLALGHDAGRGADLRHGLLFLGLALALGTAREALGHGSLLLHLDWLLGPGLAGWRWSSGLPLLTQACGGFILLGLMIAAWRLLIKDRAR